MSNHILITGASTGIGRACAQHLSQRGFTVLACVRREADGKSLKQSIPALLPLILDVTNATSIASAADQVRKIVGAQGLRGLINNAGIGVGGAVEFISIDDWRKQFEVNFFGQIAVTQAMLPLLRTYAQSHDHSARIVMIGSIAGRIGQPIMSPYSASKHALEALSDALRLELRDQKIETSLIEPGAIKSEIWRKADELGQSLAVDPQTRQYYGKILDGVMKSARKAADNAIPADHVARVIERCLTARRAPTRVLVGMDAKLGALIRKFLPDRWFDALARRTLGISK